MSSEVSSATTRSPHKVLGDVSNNSTTTTATKMHSKDATAELKTEANDMSTSLMQSPAKGDPSTERSFEEIRQTIDEALLAKICEAVHHDKSNHTLEDEVEEVVEEVLTQFYPKEFVYFKYQGQGQWGTVDSTEKRGAMRFYYMKADGKKLPTKIDGASIKRKFTPSDKDVKVILEHVAEKEVGKPWQVKAEFREQFGIKDKFASIFCVTPKAKRNSIPSTTGRVHTLSETSSEEDEVAPEADRRLSAGLAPSIVKNKKVAKPREKKEPKPKKEKVPKPPKEKKAKKENGAAGLKKFVSNSPAGSNASSPFMSPQKRGEKRFNTAVQKLADSWKKMDYSEFLLAATSAAKVLSNPQIEQIPHECHRFAVRRVFNREKDKEQLKKLSKEAKKEFRERMANERKVLYRTMDAKIRHYFEGKQEIDDLSIDSSLLVCPGRPVDSHPEKAAMFPDCLMITQFIVSLRQFMNSEETISAENLLSGLHDGRPGYMKHTVHALIPLINTLIQDEQYKKHTHFDVRLHEFTVQDTNASEMCRALLIGQTKKDDAKRIKVVADEEEDNEEEEQEKTDEAKEGENAEQDEADELNMSQDDLEEQKSLLDMFTAEKEIWQLTPAVQLAILRNLVTRILDLHSCNDYLNEDTLSAEGKSLNQRIGKMRAQVETWQEEMALLPEFDENVDETLLSRQQTRERAEVAKKRDVLARKIEDANDKVEEMVQSLEMEKHKQTMSKRLAPIGMDRHFRRYFWVPHKTPDAGIWIQDFGTTPYEKFIRECIEKGESINPETAIDEEAKPEENGVPAKAEITCNYENEFEQEKWFHIDSAEVLTSFMEQLKNGQRERSLKKFLTTNIDAISRSIRLGSRENTQSPDPEEKNEDGDENSPSTSADPLDDLKATVIQLASDLRDGYLTTIDHPLFEAKIVSAEKLKTVKECIAELVDTISQNNILVKLDVKGLPFGSATHSWFILDRWKKRLSNSANASAVHLLLRFLDQRINWKNSVTEKRCSCCGSKRSPDCKIACESCGTIVHYYCTRPRLPEKPAGAWSCAACSRQTVLKERRAAAAKKPKYVEESEEDEADDDEEEEDEVKVEKEEEELEEVDEEGDNYAESGTESDEDAFASKNKNRPSRKRVLIESDYEDNDEEEESEENPPKKRKEVSDSVEECYSVLEKIKAAHRMYRCLQTVPVPRGSRRSVGVSMEYIEKKMDEYTSFEEFVADLHTFFATAKEYFEHHNERKLDEFEELVLSLDLPETK